MKSYTKPSINRCAIANRADIAERCWMYMNQTSGSPDWWYDKNGTSPGFVKYWVEYDPNHHGGCGAPEDAFVVEWFQNLADLNDDQTGRMVVAGEAVVTDDNKTVYPFDETMAYLRAAGGSAGQNFGGEDSLIKDSKSMV